MDADSFYRARDERSAECTELTDAVVRQVILHVGADAAKTERGQQLTESLVNLLSRIHRRLCLRIPNAPLFRPNRFNANTLSDHCIEIAQAADPFISLESGSSSSAISIGIGSDLPRNLDFCVGSNNFAAELCRRPIQTDLGEGSSIGAALAACLGAAAVFRAAIGLPTNDSQISLWDFANGPNIDVGPELAPIIDVGDIVQVGAGGVGACVAYWLSHFRVHGQWSFVDHDVVTHGSLNRCLPFFINDIPHSKANIVASLVGGAPIVGKYHELASELPRFDLLLPLADEYGVRSLIGHRHEPILLHATTEGSSWQSQLHRHISGVDDCIGCRLPEENQMPELSNANGPTIHAALPFMSPTAALLLAASMIHLGMGRLPMMRCNSWRLTYRGDPIRLRAGLCRCQVNCRIGHPIKLRSKLQTRSIWNYCDPSRLHQTRTSSPIDRRY